MIDFDDAGQHLRGVWRLITGDEGWRSDMDASAEGVFRSFWAIALSLPFAVVSIFAQRDMARASDQFEQTIYAKAPFGFLAPAELLISAIIWVASVALIAFIARQIGAGRNVADFVVAYNWSQLLGYIASIVPAAAFIATGALGLGVSLFFVLLIFTLFVFWMVLRSSLPIEVGPAIAITIGLIGFAYGAHSILLSVALRLFQLFS